MDLPFFSLFFFFWRPAHLVELRHTGDGREMVRLFVLGDIWRSFEAAWTFDAKPVLAAHWLHSLMASRKATGTVTNLNLVDFFFLLRCQNLTCKRAWDTPHTSESLKKNAFWLHFHALIECAIWSVTLIQNENTHKEHMVDSIHVTWVKSVLMEQKNLSNQGTSVHVGDFLILYLWVCLRAAR